MQSNDGRKRILIADDEAMTLEFFEVMLGKLGFEVRAAANGADALEILGTWKPDLMIIDNVLPKVSGWDITRKVRSGDLWPDLADVPIIMFSAMDDVKDKVEGLELGADDYITKPFHFSEVLARIRVLLRTRELVGQIERREERIRITDEIISRMLSFAAELKVPLMGLNAQASELLPVCSEAAPFIERTHREVSSALRKLAELDEAIAPLKAEAEQLRSGDTDLHALRHRGTGKAGN